MCTNDKAFSSSLAIMIAHLFDPVKGDFVGTAIYNMSLRGWGDCLAMGMAARATVDIEGDRFPSVNSGQAAALAMTERVIWICVASGAIGYSQ
jgi:hypothetical protein